MLLPIGGGIQSWARLRDMARSIEPSQTHIRSPLETAAPISRLRRQGPRRRDPSLIRHSSQLGSRSPPGSAEADQASRDECIGVISPDSLHDGTFDDHARGHVFPQRHEQLPCKGDDGCLFEARLIAHHAFVEPAGKR